MPDSVILRPAVLEDAEFLFGVYAASRESELAQLEWDDATKNVFLRQQFRAQDSYYHEHYPAADFLVIEQGNIPIGRLYLARTAEEIRIVDISLLPEFRNLGIGSRLMHSILNEAAASRRVVRIHVEKSNPALALYQRLGFGVLEDRPVYLFMEWSDNSSRNAAATSIGS